jgi:hypothetical protein
MELRQRRRITSRSATGGQSSVIYSGDFEILTPNIV